MPVSKMIGIVEVALPPSPEESHNLTIDFRWAENQYDRLPALAADLAEGMLVAAMTSTLRLTNAELMIGDAQETARTMRDSEGTGLQHILAFRRCPIIANYGKAPCFRSR